jgi:WD40 repeat protein
VWDATNGALLARADRAHTGRPTALAWSADGERLASAGEGDASVGLWSARELAPAGELRGHEGHVLALVRSGARLASAGQDGALYLWSFGP